MGTEFSDQNQEHLHPAFAEGKQAFSAGQTLDSCPYGFGTDEYDAWRQGWNEALSMEFK